MYRRRYLSTAATASILVTTGCTTSSDTTDDPATQRPPTTTEATATEPTTTEQREYNLQIGETIVLDDTLNITVTGIEIAEEWSPTNEDNDLMETRVHITQKNTSDSRFDPPGIGHYYLLTEDRQFDSTGVASHQQDDILPGTEATGWIAYRTPKSLTEDAFTRVALVLESGDTIYWNRA